MVASANGGRASKPFASLLKKLEIRIQKLEETLEHRRKVNLLLLKEQIHLRKNIRRTVRGRW